MTGSADFPSGRPRANPIYLVDVNGNQIGSSQNPLQVAGTLTTTPSGIQRVDAQAGDFPAGSIVDLATLAAAISANRMQSNVAQIGGQSPTLDNTTILAASMRAKNSVAGDTSIQANSDGSIWQDIRRYNGVVVGAGNPQITQDQVRAYILAGQSFSAATPKQTSGTGTNIYGWQLFNPASSGKSLLIYSLVLVFNTSNAHLLEITGADASGIAGWSGNNITVAPVNNKAGSATTSVATCGFTATNITGTLIGTLRELTGTQNAQPVEILTNGECIYLPADIAVHGIALYLNSGASGNVWGVTCNWLEF